MHKHIDTVYKIYTYIVCMYVCLFRCTYTLTFFASVFTPWIHQYNFICISEYSHMKLVLTLKNLLFFFPLIWVVLHKNPLQSVINNQYSYLPVTQASLNFWFYWWEDFYQSPYQKSHWAHGKIVCGINMYFCNT